MAKNRENFLSRIRRQFADSEKTSTDIILCILLQRQMRGRSDMASGTGILKNYTQKPSHRKAQVTKPKRRLIPAGFGILHRPE